MMKLSGHIGSSASALVDGQLSPQEAERAWGHVLTCPGCRRLVEREGWVKLRLSTLSDPARVAAPAGLVGALSDVDAWTGWTPQTAQAAQRAQSAQSADSAWAAVDDLERRSTRRRAALAAVGAGSVGVAVLGLVTLTTPPAGRGEVPGAPSTANIRADVSGSGNGTTPGVPPVPLRRASR